MVLTLLAATPIGCDTFDSVACATATCANETLSMCVFCIQHDYCMDNRGDVGSWVREAAMDAIPFLLAAAQRTRASRCDAETSDGEDNPIGDSTQTGEHITLALTNVTTIVAVLLKQAAEKIDRVRSAAFAALVQTLRGDDDISLSPLTAVPAYAKLLRAIPETQKVAAAWAAPGNCFPALATLIAGDGVDLAPYRESLLEGFVVSAGGVGDSLGKAAGGALVAALAETGSGDKAALQLAVAKTLVDLMDMRFGNDRVVVPLLRVLDTSFSSGCLAAVTSHPPAPPDTLAAVLANKLRAELKGSRDIAKLCLGAQALCHLVGLGKAATKDGDDDSSLCAKSCATHGVLVLLVNRYPRVRRVAAETLYVTLLGDAGDENGNDDGRELAIELLSSTRWDADVSIVKPTRNKLYEMLGLVPPKLALVLATTKKITEKEVDENDSYAALVGSAGY